MKKFKCQVCGFIHDGDAPPSKCPKCHNPAEKFVELSQDAAELVEHSRHTNLLLMRLATTAREIEHTCKEGIKDGLDPNCVALFGQSLSYAYEIMKLAMTEISLHNEKNKWG